MINLKDLANELERLSWQANKVQMKIWAKCRWLKLDSDDEAQLESIYRRPYPPDAE
jgi:hypothetical protein